jgi:hypothetical protein
MNSIWNLNCHIYLSKIDLPLKFIHDSKKATELCDISTVVVFDRYCTGQIYGEDFAIICGLLRIFELLLKLPTFLMLNRNT